MFTKLVKNITGLSFELRTAPEPSPFLLLATGIAGLFWKRMKKDARSIATTYGN